MPIEVGAAPYYEAAATRKTTLGRFAAAVAHNPGTVREQLQEEQQARAPPGHAEYLFVGLHGNGASSDRERAMQRALETALEAWLPPVLREALERNHLHSKAWVQFSLGPAGAGSGMHYHVAALNTLAYGRKHWTLLPPRDAVYSATPVRRWHALGGRARLRAEGRAVYECVQQPGDVLYIPDHVGHAVLNLAPSVGFAVEVATARGRSMRLELDYTKIQVRIKK